jgi:integrase
VARFSEVSALRPGDVDRVNGTVRISRAWKVNPDGPVKWSLGRTKTDKSTRTIDVDPGLLAELDYSHDWLFVNKFGGPVRIYGWRENVWNSAVRKADLGVRPRVHDLRHTCASWMIARGVPLPVIQQHLGHESIETTVGIYGHLDRGLARAAARALAEHLNGV